VEEPKKEASRSKEPEILTMEATAYTHTGNMTKTETWPRVGTVAVDPKVIPLGTELYVEGYGKAVAEDTGRLIKGMRIDVFLETEQECIKWGRKMVKVRVLE
jgi:3D (Asp-Asp-Asp) domain-containing protein